MTSLMKTDERYKKWISDVSKRFRQSQLKVAVKVNSKMLRLYWSMGKDIALLSERAGYGSNFYEMYPGADGICRQLVDESGIKENGQQPVDELEAIN